MATKQRVFEYVVLHHPTAKKDLAGNEEVVKTKLLVDVKRVLATDEKEVGIVAAREIPEGYLDKLEQVEIVVRPF